MLCAFHTTTSLKALLTLLQGKRVHLWTSVAKRLGKDQPASPAVQLERRWRFEQGHKGEEAGAREYHKLATQLAFENSPTRGSPRKACSDLKAASVRTPLASGDRTTSRNGSTSWRVLKPERSERWENWENWWEGE